MQTPKTHVFRSRSKVTFLSYRKAAIFERMAAIMDVWVKMMSSVQTDVIIGILVVVVSSHMLLGALVQTFLCRSTRWRPSWMYGSK